MQRLADFLRRGGDLGVAPPRLYLHIGLNKAGSSAIQRTLTLNERLLRHHGLLYPRTGRSKSQAHHLVSHVLGFSQGKPPAVRSPRQFEDLDAKLHAEARKARCPAVIVSSELFTNPGDIPRVREFFSNWDVRIVVYLRRHDHWWASCYSQGVKTVSAPPWPVGFDGYMAFQRTRRTTGKYRLLVARWAEVFGAHNIIVRPYEREQNQPSIVSDLLGALGYPELAAALGEDVGVHNPSLGEREIVLIDVIQHAGLPEALRRRLVKAISQRAGQLTGGGFLSPALRRQLIEDNLDDYRHIAETYLGRADGQLFREPLPDPAEPWAAPAPASHHEIIEAVTAAAGWPAPASKLASIARRLLHAGAAQ